VLRILAMGLLLAVSGAAFGQSLGDAARQARQKEKARPKAAKKVITNEDIPESSATATSPEEAGKSEPTVSASGSPNPLTPRQWREKIVEQKEVIETLVAKINKRNSSIHFITASESSNAVEYNQYQVKAQQDVKAMQKQLDDESKKLADMQEAAQKEGMGAGVYDP
jgi:hypothetical protein